MGADRRLDSYENRVYAQVSLEGASMRVSIDSEKCQGHNRCYALAPDLIDVDDMGMAVVIGDGTISSEQEAKARLLVANCPEYAISLND